MDIKGFPDEYFIEGHYGMDWKRAAMYKQEHVRILKHCRGGKILDIGCGFGDFVVTLPGEWERFGVDPSEYAYKMSSSKGITMLTDLPQNTFDVVVFRGSQQTIPNLIEVLYNAVNSLKPGGMLVFLATPNTGSLVYRLFQNLPPLYDKYDWFLLSSKQLKNILHNMDAFSEIEFYYPYWGTPYAKPVKDFFNFFASLLFGYRKFAFYGNIMECFAWKRLATAS